MTNRVDKNNKNRNAFYMQVMSIFFIGMAIGLLSEVLVSFISEAIHHKPFRIHHRFSLGKRLSLVMLPIWGILAVFLFDHNIGIVMLFLLSAVVGTIFEFLTGYFFYRAFEIKIWTYKHGALGKFTSIYSIPYWGGGGLLFFGLAKIIGL